MEDVSFGGPTSVDIKEQLISKLHLLTMKYAKEKPKYMQVTTHKVASSPGPFTAFQCCMLKL